MLFHATDCACRECIIERSVHQAEHAGQRHTFDVSDLDDVTPLPAAPVVLVRALRCDGSHTAGFCHDPNCKFRNQARSRAKRRR